MSPIIAKTPLRIAIVEDDKCLLRCMSEYLILEGYSVWGVGSAEAFYKRFLIDPVQVVILDIGLPGESGLSVAEHLRDLPGVAVIIQSGHDLIEDRLSGLRTGANRYLVKPVAFSELVANIKAVERWSATAHILQEAILTSMPEVVLWSLARLDCRLTAPNGKFIVLTAREFLLIVCLIEAEGDIVSKSIIGDKIIGRRIINSSERLDVLLARLRKKCVNNVGISLPVKTMHHVGYMFTAPAVLI
jgi:DNA-binding response OmpR family regulator